MVNLKINQFIIFEFKIDKGSNLNLFPLFT